MEDLINHPSHYTDGFGSHSFECTDISQYLDFCSGNAFKYLWRAGKKTGEEATKDLQKARWYLNRLISHRIYPSKEGIYAARAVFKLIAEPTEEQQQRRWGALAAVVNCRWDLALAMIDFALADLGINPPKDEPWFTSEDRAYLESVRKEYHG